MKTTLKVMVAIFAVLIAMRVVGELLLYASTPSDLAVATSYVGICFLLVAEFLLFKVLFFRKTKKEKKMSARRSSGLMVILLLIAVASFVTGCTTIKPGSVGILVNQYGKNRGVQDYTTTTGYVTYNPVSTSVLEYPTYVQTVKWTKNPNEGRAIDESITFTTKESVSINADISLSYQLLPEKVPAFYVKFRNDDLETFTDGFLHNIARDAMTEIGGHYTVENVMGDNEEFLHAVKDRIQGQVGDIGVQIQQFGFIGSPRPPQQIVDSINAAQQAKYLVQQKQNEVLQAKQDADKAREIAHGIADANNIVAASITENLLKKQALDLQDRWIARWNGQRPTVEAGSNAGSGLPMLLNVNPK